MNTLRKTATAFLAAATLVAAASAALAVSAVATGNVNVRTGPSIGFSKVDILVKGERVDVRECKSGWCYVEHKGPDGWVSGKYLAKAYDDYNNGYNDHYDNEKPHISFGMGFGPGGPTFGFGYGHGGVVITPPPPPAPKVCVYNLKNFGGAKKCFTSGASAASLTGYWNDRISSVSVEPGATITLCRNPMFGGFCRTYTHSQHALPPMLNNKVSSVEIY